MVIYLAAGMAIHKVILEEVHMVDMAEQPADLSPLSLFTNLQVQLVLLSDEEREYYK